MQCFHAGFCLCSFIYCLVHVCLIETQSCCIIAQPGLKLMILLLAFPRARISSVYHHDDYLFWLKYISPAHFEFPGNKIMRTIRDIDCKKYEVSSYISTSLNGCPNTWRTSSQSKQQKTKLANHIRILKVLGRAVLKLLMQF